MKKNILLQLFCLSFIAFSCSDDDSADGEIEIPAVESAILDIESGGSTQPNQVYIDLSTEKTTVVRRDSWELGFTGGAENRVVLNPSILAAAAALDGIYDIDAVTTETELSSVLNLKSFNLSTFQSDDVAVSRVSELLDGLALGYNMYGDLENGIRFTDSKEGDLNATAIGTIATSEEEAEVYIVSLGNEIPTEEAEAGSINTSGEHRGYYKIKVFINNGGYVLHYAPLDETRHQEATISKDEMYNFTAFSLMQERVVTVEPAKDAWDLNYTSVYSYYGSLGGMVAGLTYSDYMLHNTHGGAAVYAVITETTDEDGNTTTTDAPSYDEFTVSDVQDAEFVTSDRTLIASDWRSTSDGAKSDRFYIVKDPEGNVYKLQFTALLNGSGERGYPQIKYDLL